MANRNNFDIAIVGAGVSGVYASYCCGISGIDCCLFDTLSCPGGQCTTFYPDKKTYGIPGFLDIKACDFIELLKKQASSFSTIYDLFNEKITKIKKDGAFFVLNDRYIVDYIILATGIGNMKPSIPPGIAGVDRNDGFVQYYCMKADLYKGKDVVIAGGGDSAADFAINISQIARKIILVHRRDKLTCDANKIEILQKLSNVEIKLSHNIISVENNSSVTTDKETFNVDHVVFCYGFRADPNFIDGLSELNIKTDNKNLIAVDLETMQTNVDKVFAIGDAITYKNKKKNIISCFFEADRAVRMIKSKMFSGMV